MTLLAAFKVLLFRYTGEYDIVVGSPIAGRNRVETENLIGFFVNSLALHWRTSPEIRHSGNWWGVSKWRLTLTHAGLPFEKLVEELNPVRDVSRTPVFQVMFGLQNAPRAAIEMHNLSVKRSPVESRTAEIRLDVTHVETADGLSGWLGKHRPL